MTADDVIHALGLEPLPVEGGYYRETYRASEEVPREVLPERYGQSRALATAIYFLVTPAKFSSMHRLPTDELWFFHAGDPLEMLLLYPGGAGECVCLGSDFAAGEQPQLTVPMGTWQGARPSPGGTRGFSLVSTVMSPGFEFADLHPATRGELLNGWPSFAEMITALTREG
ncbi:MAG: cupin domain-containing protein [Opitutales bacterium]